MGMLQNRVALITGAGAGIGKGIARAFAREGATVVVAEYNEETGRETAAELAALGGRGVFIETDILKLPTVEHAIQQTIVNEGKLDILVNNAYPTMHGMPTRIEKLSGDRFEHSMTAGFHAVVRAMQVAFPAMKKNQRGRIINICSLNGVNAHKYTADYNSTKEAVRAFTRTAAVEWAAYGITANIICPGAATTPFHALAEFMPQMADEVVKNNPMGRLGDPEQDIGGVALFLASDLSAYVTGNTLFADGGGHINGVPWGMDPVE
ncbi:MAG: SDR family oxidoreductase [Halieaceae bacterium]|jgi:NAD(P)-dependent dehydrogenase (short-subunit alcohol dehydrogenase family)|nr:SDR family oxidoreductase [Halieaceae bacterium]